MKAKELWDLYVNDQLEEVDQQCEPDDYSTTIYAVFKDPEGRYWQMCYETGHGGDVNSWREGYAEDPDEVEPYEVTTTAYRLKKE